MLFKKEKIKTKSNKKNIKYIPLLFDNNLIKIQLKNTNQYIRIIETNESEIKNILTVSNYKNKYKIFIDINNKNIKYYLMEIVYATNIEESTSKFITIGKKELKDKNIIKLIRQYYRKEDFNNDVNEKNPRDSIAPYNLKFKDDYFETDKFKGIVNVAENIKEELFDLKSVIEKLKYRTIISIDFKRVNEEKILKIINEKSDIVPESLIHTIPKISEKIENSVNSKIGLILSSFTIVHLSDINETNEEVIEKNTYLRKLFNYNGMHLICMKNNQRKGLEYALPYGKENKDVKLVIDENKFINILTN